MRAPASRRNGGLAAGAGEEASMTTDPDRGANGTHLASELKRLLKRSCAVTGRIFLLRDRTPDRWLAAASEAVLEIREEPVAAHAFVGVPPVNGTPWAVTAFGCAGVEPDRAAELRAEADAGWTGDTTWDQTPRGGAARRSLIDDAAWSASEHRGRMERLGLYEFARAGLPLETVDGAQVIVIQVWGLDPAWDPGDHVVHALACITIAARDAFHAQHVVPSMHRKRLLDLLSPTQRTIVPYLAEGYSETQIAGLLDKSQHTIHDHTKAIYATWGVRSRLQLRDKWLGISELVVHGAPAATAEPAVSGRG